MSFGANVEPWATEFSSELKTRSKTSNQEEAGADGDVAARERLRDGHDVRLEPPVVEREHPAGAAEPSLYLVDTEERAVASAEELGSLEVSRIGHDSALALDRLDQEQGDVLSAQLLLEGLEIVERHGREPGQQRPEPSGEPRFPFAESDPSVRP